MAVIVDVFGGDNAPLAILKGCEQAALEYGIDVILAGNEKIIKKTAQENNISLDKMDIINAESIITMEDDPSMIMNAKKDCSMAEGLKALSDGKGDAFVSGGSTGALLIGASFIVKRLKGIKRCALAPIIPNNKGCHMLIDCGANVECRPEMLMQFAVMGSVYMEKVMNIQNPRVGLVNVGTEETKGGELQLAAYDLLKNSNLNFTGNIESREIPFGGADVVVTDGFTGNIILKLTEGLVGALMSNIKDIFTKNLISKVAAASVKPGIKVLKEKMDIDEYGGAPLLGTIKPVFKAHGNSNEKAIKNAIRLANDFAKTKVIDTIKDNL